MSGDPRRNLERLAAELAETPCALAALATLQQHGGSASCGVLRSMCSERVGDALRWLAAVKLVHPVDDADILDVDRPDAVYELTPIGAALIRSLTDLAELLQIAKQPDRVPVSDC